MPPAPVGSMRGAPHPRVGCPSPSVCAHSTVVLSTCCNESDSDQLSRRNEISYPLGRIVEPATCDDVNFSGLVVPFRLLRHVAVRQCARSVGNPSPLACHVLMTFGRPRSLRRKSATACARSRGLGCAFPGVSDRDIPNVTSSAACHQRR